MGIKQARTHFCLLHLLIRIIYSGFSGLLFLTVSILVCTVEFSFFKYIFFCIHGNYEFIVQAKIAFTLKRYSTIIYKSTNIVIFITIAHCITYATHYLSIYLSFLLRRKAGRQSDCQISSFKLTLLATVI